MIKRIIKEITKMIRKKEEEIDHLHMIVEDQLTTIQKTKEIKDQIIQEMIAIILERTEMHVKIERLRKNLSQ